MLLLDPIPYSFRREITCLPWNRSDITTAKETTAILVCACVRVYRKNRETLDRCNRFFLSFITSHDSIIRKRLRQRLPLTFAKCQSFSDRSCNIFLELTRCRNFDVLPGPRMHVHQSRICFREILFGKNLFTGYLTMDEDNFVGEQYRCDFSKSLKVFRNFVREHWRRIIRSIRSRSSLRDSHEENWLLELGTRHSAVERKNLHAIRFDIEKRARR